MENNKVLQEVDAAQVCFSAVLHIYNIIHVVLEEQCAAAGAAAAALPPLSMAAYRAST
jgi:hypothetical protein